MTGHLVVDISSWLDTTGCTPAAATGDGAFNVWGNTFAVEDLPSPQCLQWTVGGVPFTRVTPGQPDNLRCRGQYVPLPEGGYDWLHVLAAAERRTEDAVLMHFADGAVDPEWLRLSDFWPGAAARFGEVLALRGTRMHYPRHVQHTMRPALWAQRVAVSRRAPLVGVRLPENPALHVFAITLQEAEEVPCA